MVINSGFNFTNTVFKNCWIEDEIIWFSSDFFHTRVYCNEKSNNVLLDFLALDIKKDDSVISFHKQYGSLVNMLPQDNISEPATVKVKINDNSITSMDVEEKKRKREKGTSISFNLDNSPNAVQFGIDMYVFQHCQARIKALMNLITALQLKDHKNLIINALFLGLDQQPQYIPPQMHLIGCSLSYDLDCFTQTIFSPHKTIQEGINDALTSDYCPLNDLVFPFWLNLLRILKNICSIEAISNECCVIFDKEIEHIVNELPEEFWDLLTLFSKELICSEINLNITGISPVLRSCTADDFIGDWHIPNLLSALYLDIYLKQANSTILKKCENPTCNQYFEVNPSETRKKYCSTRCAQLMAKRKQREREKNRK